MLKDCNRPLEHPAIVRLQPLGSRTPLFWVDGGPMFLPVAKLLGLDQPVFGLRVPPSETSQLSQLRVPYRIEDGAALLLRYLREVQPAGPYCLAGLCAAGLVAYEMARQLAAVGEGVALLTLFDVPAPVDRDADRRSGATSQQSKTGILLAELWQGGIHGLPGFAVRRSSAIARRFKLLRWRGQQAIGLQINRDKLVNDRDAIEQPQAYFSIPRPYSGRVIFFQSDEWQPPNAAWDSLIAGGWQVRRVPGGHVSMFQGRNANALASSLRDCLDSSQSKST
jgi:thioesterase domain-containing protein